MSSSAFTPSTTTVTNNVPTNVPVVTAWEAYTPTFEGFGTPTSVSVLWRRVGDNIQVTGNFTSGTPTSATATISLPSGLNLDSTKINGPGQTKILGFVMRANSTSTQFPSNTRGPFVITESKNSSTSKVYLSFTANTLAGGAFEVAGGTNILTSGELLTFEFNAPISQWAGSGTTTLATRAVEEYLSTTSFSSLNVNRGPNGAALPTTTPSGTFESISFGPNPWQTTWLATDIVSIEVDPFGNGKWTSIAGSIDVVSLTVQEGSLTYIGLGFYYDGTNWILLRGKYRNPNTTNGVWSSMGAGARYRIKKVSSGAQVGYPVSARNIVGDTSGSVVPVGMLGEVVTWSTAPSTFALTTTESDWTNATFTLNQGVWLMCFHIQTNARTPTGSGTQVSGVIKVTNSSNVTQGELTCSGRYSDASFFTIDGILSQSAVLNVSSTTTYKIRAYKTETGGTGVFNLLNSDLVRSKFYAVRIA